MEWLKTEMWRSEVGWFIRRAGRNWVFLWAEEMLVVENLGHSWMIYVDSKCEYFDDLFEALDWWDDRLHRKENR